MNAYIYKMVLRQSLQFNCNRFNTVNLLVHYKFFELSPEKNSRCKTAITNKWMFPVPQSNPQPECIKIIHNISNNIAFLLQITQISK